MNGSVVYRPLRSVLVNLTWEEYYHLYEWEFDFIQLLLWDKLLGSYHKICVVDILLDLQYSIFLFEIIAVWAVKLIDQPGLFLI